MIVAICPATRKPCIDDLCYGGGCRYFPGEMTALLVPCDGCGGLIPLDGSDTDECTCEPEEWHDEEDRD